MSPRFFLSFASILAIALVLIVLAVLTLKPAKPNEFAGTLLTDMVYVGGEGTGIALRTKTGLYDLEIRNSTVTLDFLRPLSGRSVVVRGFAGVGRGLERGRYPIIRVVSVQAL